MNDIWNALKAPFPPDIISWRIGSTTSDKKKGMALAYIDARDVAERLDAVLSPQNWQCDYPHAGAKTVCRIGVRIGDDWVWKADGAGDTDHEAEKGALSDAFKRAAVRFGVGRYLYDVKNSWVEIEPAGKSYKIVESEYARLRKMLPAAINAPDTMPKAFNATKTETIPIKDALCRAIWDCPTKTSLEALGTSPDFLASLQKLNDDLKQVVRETYSERLKELLKGLAA